MNTNKVEKLVNKLSKIEKLVNELASMSDEDFVAKSDAPLHMRLGHTLAKWTDVSSFILMVAYEFMEDWNYNLKCSVLKLLSLGSFYPIRDYDIENLAKFFNRVWMTTSLDDEGKTRKVKVTVTYEYLDE